MIVVGYVSTKEGEAALERAFQECRLRDDDLTVIHSDRLYPPRLSHEIVAARPGTQLRTISSAVGHDGFLTEVDQVAGLLRDVLRGE